MERGVRMNRDAMLMPFADEEIRTFDKSWKDKKGETHSFSLTYIEDETVMDRLDVGYGFGNWQVQVEPFPYVDGVVKVRLGVREHDEWVWYEDFGYPNREGGESLKEAVSDGIRRCGRMVGIARDLYRKSTYERPRAPQTPVAARTPSGPPNRPPLIRETGSDGLVGKAATSGTQDFNLRETPDGQVLPFRVKEGNRAGQIVVAHDAIAVALFDMRESVIGQTVTVWGTYQDVDSPPKPDGYVVTYKVLHLSRITTPDWDSASIPPKEPETVPMGLVPDDDLSDLPDEWHP